MRPGLRCPAFGNGIVEKTNQPKQLDEATADVSNSLWKISDSKINRFLGDGLYLPCLVNATDEVIQVQITHSRKDTTKESASLRCQEKAATPHHHRRTLTKKN